MPKAIDKPFDFEELWRPIDKLISKQFKNCPEDHRQEFADSLERKYRVILRKIPGSVAWNNQAYVEQLRRDDEADR